MDASAILTLCFEDEDNAYGQLVLDAVEEGTGIIVPSLWPVEVGNGLLMAEKRGRLKADELSRFLSLLRDLDIELDQQNVPYTIETIVPLARQHKLTVYDAMYLELALRRGLPLATLDKRLAEACRTAGVALI